MKQSLIPSYVIARIVPSYRQTTDQGFTMLSSSYSRIYAEIIYAEIYQSRDKRTGELTK